jgi:hypothetical protein
MCALAASRTYSQIAKSPQAEFTTKSPSGGN